MIASRSMFISFDSSSGVRWFAIPLAPSLGYSATKKPGAVWRLGLESSRVGWAAHHSLHLHVSTVSAYTGFGTSTNSHSRSNVSARRSASALIPKVSVA
jgi:hypothetical protein